MATPLTAEKFLAALKAEGVKVAERKGWKTHNREGHGAWGPVHGVMLHHTGRYNSEEEMIDLCWTGYSGLPGPLCQGVIDRAGTVHLVGYGRCNHAGSGDGDVLDAVIDEKNPPVDDEADTDGNARFYGFESINRGDGEDWPKAQVEAMVRVSAAVLRAHGWNQDGQGGISVIGHKEWQPGKPDPAGVDMTDVRQRVGDRLRHGAGWSPLDSVKKTVEQRLAALEKRVGALEKGVS
jgi:hypothetical protein